MVRLGKYPMSVAFTLPSMLPALSSVATRFLVGRLQRRVSWLPLRLRPFTPRARKTAEPSVKIDLPDTLALSEVFHLSTDGIAQLLRPWHCFEGHPRRGLGGRLENHVRQGEQAQEKRLLHGQVLHPVELQLLSPFGTNAPGLFESLGRQLVDGTPELEPFPQGNEDRDDEPERQATEQVQPQIRDLRRTAL